MSKERAFSRNYKHKSNVIDQRALRGYRKSVDWKQLRDDEISRRRNLDVVHETTVAMSPVAEKEPARNDTDETDGSKSRREMLMRWKEEKDLKKKLEAMKNSKKKPFRVLHVEHQIVQKPAAKKIKTEPVISIPVPAAKKLNESSLRTTRGSKANATTSNTSAPARSGKNSLASHVNTKRGDTSSFAPTDFQFSAPSHLAFEFRPMSPNSAAMFLRPSSANTSLTNSDTTIEVNTKAKQEVNATKQSKANKTVPQRSARQADANVNPLKKNPTKAAIPKTLPSIPEKPAVRSTRTTSKPAQVQETGYLLRSSKSSSSQTLDPKAKGFVAQTKQQRVAKKRADKPAVVLASRAGVRSNHSEDTAVDKKKIVKRVHLDEEAASIEKKDLDEDVRSESVGPTTMEWSDDGCVSSVFLKDPNEPVAIIESAIVNGNVLESGRKTPHGRRSLRSGASESLKTPVNSRIQENLAVDVELFEMVTESSSKTPNVRRSLKSRVNMKTPKARDSQPEEQLLASSSEAEKKTEIDSNVPEDIVKVASESNIKTPRIRRSLQSCASLERPQNYSLIDKMLVIASEEVGNKEPSNFSGQGNECFDLPVLVEGEAHDAMKISEQEESTSGLSGANNTHEHLFQTPRQLRRGRSLAHELVASASSRRKTPKNVRNSLLLRRYSPEDCIEILKESPMIEMDRRRTPRVKPTSPMLDLDDVDEIIRTVDSTGQTVEDVVNASFQLPTVSNELPRDAPADDNDNQALERPVSPMLDPLLYFGPPNVPQFRSLLRAETERLQALCATWTSVLLANQDLSEEITGSIRTVIGKAELLIAQRFKQFSGLVDNCEFKNGEKEVTCTDLQGFWDMIYFQVEDVNGKFIELDQLKSANWIIAKPTPIKKKVVKKSVATSAANKEPAVRPVKSSFADFRRKMQQQKKQPPSEEPLAAIVDEASLQNEEIKTFEGGFFKVSSPVKSPALNSTPNANGTTSHSRRSLCRAGHDSPLLTAVLKRSARKSLGTTNALNVAEDKPGASTLSNEAQSKRLHSILHHSDAHDAVTGSDARSTRPLRKSVCFKENKVVILETPKDSFADLHDTNECTSGTPDTAAGKENLECFSPITMTNNTARLVGVSEEEEYVEDNLPQASFVGLNVGFTPGVDGKTRRISGFSPMMIAPIAFPVLGELKEHDDSFDLMGFSPVTTKDSNAKARRSSVRKSIQPIRRRSSRLSVN